MNKRCFHIELLIIALIANVAYSQSSYAPIAWDTAGVNIRQGHHTEWFRAGVHDPVTGEEWETQDKRLEKKKRHFGETMRKEFELPQK